jgi:predicted permease
MSRAGIDHDIAIGFEGQVTAADQDPEADFRIASPGYFRTMGIPFLRGRDFTNGDHETSPAVAIVNRSLVERLLPGQDPLGQRIRWGRQGRRVEVVGVVGDVRHRGLDARPRPELYVPFRQTQYGSLTLVVRAAGDPLALAAAVKSQLYAIDPGQPVTALATMKDLLSDSVAGPRFQVTLLGSFAAVALALACVGIYGVISELVAQRTREIGIRLALGGRGADVLGLLLRQGLRLTSLGIALGLAGAFAVTRLLGTLLFEVSPHDPVTYGAVSSLLFAAALLACGVPAWRATRVDPMRALRCD